jgi:two-component system, sensor histidine kinase
LRLLPDIRHGPEGHLDKQARRLRVRKLMAWSAFAVAGGFSITQFLDPTPGMWKAASVNAVAALFFVLLPQLVRVARLPAMVTVTIFIYVYILANLILFGTAIGVAMFYLVLAGLSVVTYGTERIRLVAFFGLLGAALIIATEALVPRTTGLYAPKTMFVTFVVMSLAATVLLMAIVYYSLRTAEQAEEALARDNEIIQDKTRQLEDKTRQLEMANTYKSHFLASASHDLRQPLHALNLFVAQLQSEADPAERRRLVARIDASVGSMNELFEALLDMTKLEAGIIRTSPAEFPVARLLERVETTFADAAPRRGLRLRVVASRAWVTSDPILLERILLNLVSNALRYTEHGGVVVGCRRRGKELRIDVCDTGAGIPEDQRQRIFAEYYQLSSGPGPSSSGGLGLGLAIVDRLGRLLGHKVELDSRPGRGSRFSVTVPVAAQPYTAAEVPMPSPAIADPAQGKRVIVIDDDALVLDGMRGILQSWGCQVETAASGDAALAGLAASGSKPDLIISDSRLADGETGIEAIRRLRQAAGIPIPAFVITGDTAPERLREASAAGLHLLHKPLSPMALRTTLNRLLRLSAAARPGGEA